nr:MAG TPA_asm: hypothetical protein [Caudoviricetes sp.]
MYPVSTYFSSPYTADRPSRSVASSYTVSLSYSGESSVR